MHAQNHDVVILVAVGLFGIEDVMLLLIVGNAFAVSRESDVVLLACLPNRRSLSLIHCCHAKWLIDSRVDIRAELFHPRTSA